MILRFALIASLFALIFGGVLRPVGMLQRGSMNDPEEERGSEDAAPKTPEQARKLSEAEARLPTPHASHLAHAPAVTDIAPPQTHPAPPPDHAPPDVHRSPLRMHC